MAVFSGPLMLCSPGTWLGYFLRDFEMVTYAPVVTGITFVLTIDNRCISILSYLYFKTFRLLSWSYFSVLKLQFLFTHMFPFHYHGLWYPVHCPGWFYQFSYVDSRYYYYYYYYYYLILHSLHLNIQHENISSKFNSEFVFPSKFQLYINLKSYSSLFTKRAHFEHCKFTAYHTHKHTHIHTALRSSNFIWHTIRYELRIKNFLLRENWLVL